MLISTLFWCSLACLVYTFAGYPVFLRLLNVMMGRQVSRNDTEKAETLPKVSFLLVASNEEARIVERLHNLAACRYDGEREIILVCDGGEDATAERARACGITPPVRLIEIPGRRGKASGLNAGVEAATGEILVFADARQRFDEEAVNNLLAPMLLSPDVAAVSGSLEIEPSEEGAAAGMDAYWKLEKWIRNEESKFDSVIGCTGAIYAMRRSEFRAIPEDTLIDDVVVPMQALVEGKRILFSSAAKAYDPQTLQPQHENRRKIRTLAGNYQMLFRYPEWLNPIRNRCWWQLISHKYLRLAGPVFLFLCLATSTILALDSIFFCIAVILQTLCYLLGIVGLLRGGMRLPLFTIPAGFLFLQWQSVRALVYYLAMRMRSSGGSWSS
jgi:cellulose synthase/poly-beta-1,6-N-acetylglucosamine synthase-like glycosyltransferase